MKTNLGIKISKIISFCFIVLVSISCKKTTNSIPATKEATRSHKAVKLDYEMYYGILSKPSQTAYQYGTHTLKGNSLDKNLNSTNKQTEYALISYKFNLDSLVDKKVLISGERQPGYPIENGPELIKVMEIEKVENLQDIRDGKNNLKVIPN
jgi:hypothetical protein